MKMSIITIAIIVLFFNSPWGFSRQLNWYFSLFRAFQIKTIFTLKQYFDAEQMIKDIEKAPYLKGGTLTAKALSFVKRKLFDETGRPEVPKVLIVMTDGKSTDNITLPAQKLHEANITVFAIGIGRNYDMGQLKEIASKPDTKYALTADFNRLNELYTSIRDDACRGECRYS